jgi:hypothetical protein
MFIPEMRLNSHRGGRPFGPFLLELVYGSGRALRMCLVALTCLKLLIHGDAADPAVFGSPAALRFHEKSSHATVKSIYGRSQFIII